jgi:hypothetical protein
MRLRGHTIVLFAAAVSPACTGQDSISQALSTDAGPVIYCSPTRGPVALSEGADASSLLVCPPNGVCKHGAGPQPFGVTPPAWECDVESSSAGPGRDGS